MAENHEIRWNIWWNWKCLRREFLDLNAYWKMYKLAQKNLFSKFCSLLNKITRRKKSLKFVCRLYISNLDEHFWNFSNSTERKLFKFAVVFGWPLFIALVWEISYFYTIPVGNFLIFTPEIFDSVASVDSMLYF